MRNSFQQETDDPLFTKLLHALEECKEILNSEERFRYRIPLEIEKQIILFSQNNPNKINWSIAKAFWNYQENKFDTLLEVVKDIQGPNSGEYQGLKEVVDELKEHKRKKIPAPIPEPDIAQTDRENLLFSVKNKLVVQRFDKSFYEKKQIALLKVLHPDLVQSSAKAVLTLPKNQEPSAGEMIRIFNEDASKRLLILGCPGAGKTTALLELVKDLLTCAENDPKEPIPILLDLSTWKVNKEEITDWILTQLREKYGVRRDIGKRLLSQDQLVLLLDELDQLRAKEQEECINKINQLLQQEDPPRGIAVCSRLEEYKKLNIQIKLEEAVCLQPLTESQIGEYLESIDKLELLKSIETDPELLKITKIPLFLNILVLAFEETNLSMEEWQKYKSNEERRQYLFDAFTKKRLDKTNKFEEKFYPNKNQEWLKQLLEEKTEEWLKQLAKILKKESLTGFSIESIQPHWWLTEDEERVYNLVVRLTVGLVSGLTAGLYLGGWSYQPKVLLFSILAGVITGGVSYISVPILEQFPRFYFKLLSRTLPGLIFFGITYGLTSSISLEGWNSLVQLTGIGVGTVFCGLEPKQIKPVDKVEVEFSLERTGLHAGYGVLLGLVFVLINLASKRKVYDKEPLFWLGELLAFSLIGMLFGLIPTKEVALDLKTSPNQGIWNAKDYAIRWFLIGGIIGGTVNGIRNVIIGKPDVVPTIGIALTVGLLASLIGSDCSGLVCIRHFILRLALYYKGCIPWDYSRFLGYATELRFIQTVGGYYKFWHDSLQIYFADELTKDIRGN